MKNARWNPFKPLKEWGSKARKQEEHARGRLAADRAVIQEFIIEDEQWDHDLDAIE